MGVRTIIDIPASLHDRLLVLAEGSGTSIRTLIVRAIEQVYAEGKRGEYVTGPLITGAGKLGPAFPEDENRHHLVCP